MAAKCCLADDGCLLFWCPACGAPHGINVTKPEKSPHWNWNGSVESPTLTPSVNVVGRCHSQVTDGRINYYSDSPHALAGQTADLPDWETAHLE